MNDLDALVRGAAIGITLLLTAAFLRAWANRSRAWIGTRCARDILGILRPMAPKHKPLAAVWVIEG